MKTITCVGAILFVGCSHLNHEQPKTDKLEVWVKERCQVKQAWALEGGVTWYFLVCGGEFKSTEVFLVGDTIPATRHKHKYQISCHR